MNMDKKTTRSLGGKLKKVNYITDKVILTKEEAFEILCLSLPVYFKELKGLNELDKSDIPIHIFYRKLLSYFSDGSDPVYQRYATQVILAFALAIKVKPFEQHKCFYNVRQLLVAQEIIYQNMDQDKRANKFGKRLDFRKFIIVFNWYAEHTRKEIVEVIMVNERTIRKQCPVKPSLQKTVGKTKADLYTAEESLDVLYWWLTEFLPKKTKGYPDIPLKVAQLILMAILFEHDLSKAARHKVIKKIIPACGPEPYFYF